MLVSVCGLLCLPTVGLSNAELWVPNLTFIVFGSLVHRRSLGRLQSQATNTAVDLGDHWLSLTDTDLHVRPDAFTGLVVGHAGSREIACNRGNAGRYSQEEHASGSGECGGWILTAELNSVQVGCDCDCLVSLRLCRDSGRESGSKELSGRGREVFGRRL